MFSSFNTKENQNSLDYSDYSVHRFCFFFVFRQANYMSEAAQLRRGLKPKGKTYGLTNQKRREIREIFDLFDIDGSGNYQTDSLSDLHSFKSESQDLVHYFMCR